MYILQCTLLSQVESNKHVFMCECLSASVCLSYWDPRPAGLAVLWSAVSSSPCLPQSHPAPPSHFSPAGALRGWTVEQRHMQGITINIQSGNNAWDFSFRFLIELFDQQFSAPLKWLMETLSILTMAVKHTGCRTNFIIESLSITGLEKWL